LATGVVILISIAIAAGVVFFLALVGILWTLFSRKDDKLNPVEIEDDDDSTHYRPSSLLEHINAATRTTILGEHPIENLTDEKENKAAAASNDPFGADSSDFARAETPSDAIGGTLTGDGNLSRPARARYSFDGVGEGELALKSGQEIEVLDDRDPAYVISSYKLTCRRSRLLRWSYVRDTRTGREGVVPAAYLY
jgi:hypothetical protein